MKLLVPLDGSEHALRALRHAITLARSAPGSTIHLLAVFEEPLLHVEIGLHTAYEVVIAKLEAERAAILDQGEGVLRHAGIPHTRRTARGHVARTIAEHATSMGADGIVMGTRGMTATGNLFLGSVATRVIHDAGVPVTLVK